MLLAKYDFCEITTIISACFFLVYVCSCSFMSRLDNISVSCFVTLKLQFIVDSIEAAIDCFFVNMFALVPSLL